MKRVFGWAMMVAVIVSLCACGGAGSPSVSGSGELKGTITSSGAFALYPMVVRWGEEFTKLHPGVTFDISAGGAGKGMTDVLAGAVDVAMVSRSVHEEETAKGAFGVAVVMDAVLPTINANNPYLARLQAQGVTSATLAGVWTGQITTWGEVLGDASVTDKINVYTRSDACGAAETWGVYLGTFPAAVT